MDDIVIGTNDELLPVPGRDQTYDDIQAKIEVLESKLEDELKDLEKTHKYVMWSYMSNVL